MAVQNSKKQTRLRRAKKTRMKIRMAKKMRLCICRTAKHIYAYLIDADPSKTLACVSTLQKEVRAAIKGATGNVKAAEVVGAKIAEKAQQLKVTEVVFDRSGFRYHGRVKALAEAARAGGLKF